MDSEKEQQLFNYLDGLGFSGYMLKEDIKYHTNLIEPFFYVDHRIEYGDEAMIFRLKFEQDLQFEAYRLAQYKATHRAAIEIDHKIINGIDNRHGEVQRTGIRFQVAA